MIPPDDSAVRYRTLAEGISAVIYNSLQAPFPGYMRLLMLD